MPKKYIAGASVVLILVVAVILISRNGGTPPNLPPVSPSLNSNPAVVTTQPNDAAAPAQDFVISYDSNGFSPANITVPKNSTVTFKNLGTANFWPASNPHPIHTDYPEKGGCINSIFDACKPIPPGSSWSFKFDVPGTWGYHDHMHARFSGTVTVQ